MIVILSPTAAMTIPAGGGGGGVVEVLEEVEGGGDAAVGDDDDAIDDVVTSLGDDAARFNHDGVAGSGTGGGKDSKEKICHTDSDIWFLKMVKHGRYQESS